METGTVLCESRLERIARLEAKRARIEAQISGEMLAYADECRVEAEKYSDPRIRDLEAGAAADELALVLRIPTRTVQCRLSQARFLRTRLPQTWLAASHGEVDGYRVMVIAEAAGKLAFDDSLLSLDDRVGAYASSHTVAQLRAWLGRFVARTEPEAASRRHQRAHAERSVWIQHEADGISWLHAQLSTTDAARIDRLLTNLAAELSDNRPGLAVEQARSDALANLLLARTTDDTDPASDAVSKAAPGVVIGVTVPITTLAGLDDQPGVSFDGQFALPAPLVRELSVEPGTLFYRLLTDPRGKILDVTELGRFPSDKLRIAVAARDGTCVFPTCSRPVWACDLDHEIPHPRGPTSADNLRPLCRRHHRLKSNNLLPEAPSHMQHQLALMLTQHE